MILSIVGIMVGMIQGSRTQTNGIGADLIVRPPNQSFLVGVSGAPAPAKIADVLRKLPHVAVASPAIQQISTQTAVETIWGSITKVLMPCGLFVFLSGGPFQDSNDVIVDDVFARNGKGYHVGDMIPILNHTFRICGIVEHGKGGRKFLPIKTLGALLGAENNATLFYVKADDPKNAVLIEQEIHAIPGLSQYGVQTVQEVLAMLTPETPAWFQYRVTGRDRHCGYSGLYCYFSGDVHGCARANTRNWNFEVVRSFPVLHCWSCLAGNGLSCLCRYPSWHRPDLAPEGIDGRSLFHRTLSSQRRMDGGCYVDCPLRVAGGALKVIQP